MNVILKQFLTILANVITILKNILKNFYRNLVKIKCYLYFMLLYLI